MLLRCAQLIYNLTFGSILIPIPSTGFDFLVTFRQLHHFKRGKAEDLVNQKIKNRRWRDGS